MTDQTQSDKFKEAARDLEADESETNWEKRLKKVVKQRDLSGAKSKKGER